MNTATATITKRRVGIYSIVIVLSAMTSFVYATRTTGIFACQAAQADSDQFIGICNVTNYGDYDHGAFWFNLEPSAVDSARKANVLFIGNSRTQFALSSIELDDWFNSQSVDYYLLGFSHNENYRFLGPLLGELQPEAEVYVVNIDLFFEDDLSGPANSVMNEPGSRNRYQQKYYWQIVHERACNSVKTLCGNDSSYIRNRLNGAWLFKGNDFLARMDFKDQPVSYDWTIESDTLANYELRARKFFGSLTAPPRCIFLTDIPNSDTSVGTAKALAERLEMPFIAPEMSGLTTFDGSHLDTESAARWSKQFMHELAPEIQLCLSRTTT